MQAYWLKFTDGTTGHCEGQSAYDAVKIAEKLTGKTVDLGNNKYRPENSEAVKKLPYPRSPMIWQFDHPVSGKCPPLCFGGSECLGRGSCPKSYACSE